jgi:hypothetical protein
MGEPGHGSAVRATALDQRQQPGHGGTVAAQGGLEELGGIAAAVRSAHAAPPFTPAPFT